jgi:hypothetical protein
MTTTHTGVLSDSFFLVLIHATIPFFLFQSLPVSYLTEKAPRVARSLVGWAVAKASQAVAQAAKVARVFLYHGGGCGEGEEVE